MRWQDASVNGAALACLRQCCSMRDSKGNAAKAVDRKSQLTAEQLVTPKPYSAFAFNNCVLSMPAQC